MEFLQIYFENFFHFAITWWWLLLPFFMYPIMKGLWIYDLYARHFQNNPYVVLSVKVPKEQERSPQLMEYVLHGIWNLYGEKRHEMDTWVFGVFEDYVSLEIAAVEGKVYFGVWVRKIKSEFVMSHIYAHFPQAEIEVLENDYLDFLPDNIPNKDWDLWGTHLTLQKSDVYPIRTYPKFEDSKKGEMVDPLAILMEMGSETGPGEFFLVQLLIQAIPGGEWHDKFKEEMEKILDRGKAREPYSAKQDLIRHFGTLPWDTVYAIFKYPEFESTMSEQEQKEKEALMFRLSPGEHEAIKEMERSHEKKSFLAQYAFMYAARRESFNPAKFVGGIFGAINQFGTEELNQFLPFFPYMSSSKYWFEKSRIAFIKRRLVRLLKNRQYQAANYILNAEEVATLWHFPDLTVKSPKTPWVEDRKASAPTNLPIE
ncbi:MAG: hypothetical protein GF332_04470 [Candidatus Moranbacteria bacterium]|nr:hypothetical protein [Candidatus Moranbacteria bacterium]